MHGAPAPDGLGTGAADVLGTRLGRGLGGGLDDKDGRGSGLGDDAWAPARPHPPTAASRHSAAARGSSILDFLRAANRSPHGPLGHTETALADRTP